MKWLRRGLFLVTIFLTMTLIGHLEEDRFLEALQLLPLVVPMALLWIHWRNQTEATAVRTLEFRSWKRYLKNAKEFLGFQEFRKRPELVKRYLTKEERYYFVGYGGEHKTSNGDSE